MPSAESYFANPDFDARKYDGEMERLKPANRSLGILFTPRSGSSWLTDVLTQSKLLGKPNEWFNPNFIGNILSRVNGDTAESYIEMLRRKQKLGGVFSFEATLYQISKVFGPDAGPLDFLPANTRVVYLYRRDIALQAVSLAKAVKTDVYHSVNASDDDLARAEADFTYDADELKHWFEHIAMLEHRTIRFLTGREGRFRTLTYEDMMANGAQTVANRLLKHVRPKTELSVGALEAKHLKIGSERNQEMAARFAGAHPDLIDRVYAFRAQHKLDQLALL